MINAIHSISSKNLSEFNAHGFNSTFDHNMSQIIQKYVEDMKELYTAILDNTRDNVVNESNFKDLLDFSLCSFSEKQSMLNLKNASHTILPLEYSTNDIDIDMTIIPGNDQIRHFYKVDGCIKAPKVKGDILSILLQRYDILKNESEKTIADKIISVKLALENGENVIVPVSYCVPMNHDKDPEDAVEALYKPGIINVYTHLDKDDLYRILTIHLFEDFKFDFKLNYSNFKEMFRSVVSSMLGELNKINIISRIITDPIIAKMCYRVIYRSTLGSLMNFYEKMPTNGAKYFIIEEFKRVAKTRRTSETWNNKGYSSKNPVDVIYGSRGMDYIFNYTICEILFKKLFSPVVDRKSGIFEFIISNSLSYIIISASICIGDSETTAKLKKFIPGIIDDIDDTEDYKFSYIDSVKDQYMKIVNKFIDHIVTIAYGSFIIKHVYDARERVKNRTSTFSVKEYSFVSGLVDTGVSYMTQNLYALEKITKNFITVYESNSRCNMYDAPISMGQKGSEDNDNNGDKDNLEYILNPDGIFDHLQNVISRIVTIPVLTRILKNVSSIRANAWELSEKAVKNPVFGDDERSSESHDIHSYGIFSKESANLIDNFVGKERINTNTIPEYCKQLKINTIIGIESGDEDTIANCIRQAIVIKDVQSKNPSDADRAEINTTLEFVADRIGNLKEE